MPKKYRNNATEKIKENNHKHIRRHCSRTETRMLYQNVWKPSVRYPLDQTIYNKKKASMIKLTAKFGFNRNAPRTVLSGPIELVGGVFTPIYSLKS